LLRKIAEAIIADCADKAYICTLTGRSDCLIRTFAAGYLTEFVSMQSLAHRRHTRCAEDQIHINAADNAYLWLHDAVFLK
jgi:hypothetical protein